MRIVLKKPSLKKAASACVPFVAMKYNIAAPNKNPRRFAPAGIFSIGPHARNLARPAGHLDALDLFQHLEHTLGRLDEQALEGLAQATAFQGVATHAFAFSHVDSPVEFAEIELAGRSRLQAWLAGVFDPAAQPETGLAGKLGNSAF